jgi:hypothetical protein
MTCIDRQMQDLNVAFYRPVRLAYQPPANNTFLSEQISTSHQPLAKRTGCIFETMLTNLCIERDRVIMPEVVPVLLFISNFWFLTSGFAETLSKQTLVKKYYLCS